MSAAMVPFFALVPLEVIPTFLRLPLFGPLATYLRQSRIFPRFQFVLILSDEYAVTIICRFSELAQPASNRVAITMNKGTVISGLVIRGQ